MAVLFDPKKETFTFRCPECKTIMVANFDDEKEIEDVRDDLLYLNCLKCQGQATLLTS